MHAYVHISVSKVYGETTCLMSKGETFLKCKNVHFWELNLLCGQI